MGLHSAIPSMLHEHSGGVSQGKLLLFHSSKVSYYTHHRFYSYEDYIIHVA